MKAQKLHRQPFPAVMERFQAQGRARGSSSIALLLTDEVHPLDQPPRSLTKIEGLVRCAQVFALIDINPQHPPMMLSLGSDWR